MSNVGLNRFTFCIKCLRTLQASYSVISSNNYSDAVAVVVVATLAVYSRATCLAKAFVICQTKRVFVHWQTNVSYARGYNSCPSFQLSCANKMDVYENNVKKSEIKSTTTTFPKCLVRLDYV